MKINIGKLLGKVVTFAKQNPELVVAAARKIAPKLVSKAAPVIVAVLTKKAD